MRRPQNEMVEYLEKVETTLPIPKCYDDRTSFPVLTLYSDRDGVSSCPRYARNEFGRCSLGIKTLHPRYQNVAPSVSKRCTFEAG